MAEIVMPGKFEGFLPIVETPYCVVLALPKPIPIENVTAEIDSTPLLSNPDIESYIAKENRWGKFEADKRNKVWPGDTAEETRLGLLTARFNPDNDHMSVVLGHSSTYQTFYQRKGPEFLRQFGAEAAPLALAVGTLMSTEDGFDLWAQRIGISHDYKGVTTLDSENWGLGAEIKIAGGHVANTGYAHKTKNVGPDGQFSIIEALKIESKETGLKGEGVGQRMVVGIVWNPEQADFNLVTTAQLTVPSEYVATRTTDKEIRVVYAPNNPLDLNFALSYIVNGSVASMSGYIIASHIGRGFKPDSGEIASLVGNLQSQGEAFYGSSQAAQKMWETQHKINLALMTETNPRINISAIL